MGVPFCAELGSIPDTGVPLREQRIAYEEPTPSTGGTAGRACRGGGSPERRARFCYLSPLAVRGRSRVRLLAWLAARKDGLCCGRWCGCGSPDSCGGSIPPHGFPGGGLMENNR